MQVQHYEIRDSLRKYHRSPFIVHSSDVLANRCAVVALIFFTLNQGKVRPLAVNRFCEYGSKHFVKEAIVGVVQLERDCVIMKSKLGVNITR